MSEKRQYHPSKFSPFITRDECNQSRQALIQRVDRLAEENEAQHHAIRELQATIEQAVNLFKDFAAHNDAESIGNPVLWNSVLSVLTGSDEA